MNCDNLYLKIDGYLSACGDICSLKSAPISSTFYFVYIGNSGDMLLDFKNYFIDIWQKDGYPGYYNSYDELVKSFFLHFKKETDWKEALNGKLNFWLSSFSDFEHSYMKSKIISFMDDFVLSKNYDVYTFGEEDAEFLMYNLDYMKNDDFIFNIDNRVYLLHFGLSD